MQWTKSPFCEVTTIDELISRLAILLQSKTDLSERLNGVFVVSCPDLDHKSWTLRIIGERSSLVEGRAEGECELKLSSSDLIQLARGEISAQKLFLSGKISVRGDTNAAALFHRLFEPF